MLCVKSQLVTFSIGAKSVLEQPIYYFHKDKDCILHLFQYIHQENNTYLVQISHTQIQVHHQVYVDIKSNLVDFWVTKFMSIQSYSPSCLYCHPI